MKTTAQKLLITIPAVILTLVAVTLCTVAYLCEYNSETGFFADSTLSAVSAWIVAGVSALLLLPLAAKGKASERRVSFRGPLTYLPAGVLATTLVLLAVDLLGYAKSSLGTIFTRELLTRFDCLTALLISILAICAVGYCITLALIPTVRCNLRAYLGMLASLCFAVCTIHLFFRADTPINNPAKVADEMAFLAGALFMLSDVRLSLGRARWNDYFVFASVSAVLCGYASLPALITYVFAGEVISVGIQTSLLLFALTVFSTMRLIGVSRFDKDRPSPFVTAIDSDALAAEAKEEPEVKEEARPEPPQISIDDIDEPERQGEE